MKDTKIFGIGLSKTATTSLHRALQMLGYESVHAPAKYLRLRMGPFARTAAEFFSVCCNLADSERCPSRERVYAGARLEMDYPRLERIDAFSDIGFALFYRELDAKFPGSKFVLTTRRKEEWLESCRKFFQRENLSISHRMNTLRKKMYGATYFDAALFSSAFDRHMEGVEEHFRDRPGDLLRMDICSGEGWEVLCPFLGVSVPEVEFPHRVPSRRRGGCFDVRSAGFRQWAWYRIRGS